jgi:type III restriction enzyme
MKELQYQLEAVQELSNRANRLLRHESNKTLVFEAPTGSGKTIMMAEFLKSLIENRTDDKLFSFLWCAPRKLHKQSKKKLDKHYEDTKALKCSHFDDLSDIKIDENEILFLNWESINEDDNIIIRENEENFNLSNVLKNTRDEGRIIILLIDESHYQAKTETSFGLINMFDPKLTIEVSATPKLQGDDKYTVDREDVIIEEMIKKDILINPDLDNIISGVMRDGYKIKSSGEEESVDRLINMALAKKDKLLKAYQDEGSIVNPLMLIQLPPRNVDEDIKEEVIEILKSRFDISEDNGKLAIYLSEGSVNRENIEKKDSSVEVMIFKEAIALGWDCPRAHILVQLRDWKSITFSIQTVGRITRMPELMHYDNDDLNVGYVYTNSSDLSIHKSIAGSYASIHNSSRKEIYEDISLLSVHSKRNRDKDRLDRKFIIHFLAAAEKLNLKENITIDVDEITRN